VLSRGLEDGKDSLRCRDVHYGIGINGNFEVRSGGGSQGGGSIGACGDDFWCRSKRFEVG
jgi:hypothetical protein